MDRKLEPHVCRHGRCEREVLEVSTCGEGKGGTWGLGASGVNVGTGLGGCRWASLRLLFMNEMCRWKIRFRVASFIVVMIHDEIKNVLCYRL